MTREDCKRWATAAVLSDCVVKDDSGNNECGYCGERIWLGELRGHTEECPVRATVRWLRKVREVRPGRGRI